MTLNELIENSTKILRDLRESVSHWFESGFCNLFDSKNDQFTFCEEYTRVFGDLTIGQLIFTIFAAWVFINIIIEYFKEKILKSNASQIPIRGRPK